jgi:hypothetical protein
MPTRTNSITKSKSKTTSRSRKSRSKSRSRSIQRTHSVSKSRRKYRGGCRGNSCALAGSQGSGASSNGSSWTSTGPMTMFGGYNPYQISKDIFTRVTSPF